MKLLHCFVIVACVLTPPVANANEKPSGNAASEVDKTAETAAPSYETAEQIKAMPPCKATVQKNHACYSIFKMADGKKFSIGSPRAKQEVVKFLATLKDGQTYEFPSVFLDYQKRRARTNPDAAL